MKKIEVFMIKPLYSGLPVLEISKIAMSEFWYNTVKRKYVEKAKLYYMDTDSFIVYIKTEDIYVEIAKDVEIRFDTSNYGLKRQIVRGEIKIFLN